MEKQPLVTLYGINFNYANFVTQSIDSVLSQTYKNLEIIIVDDGSFDDSKNVLQKYKTHKNLKIIEQDNLGLIQSIRNIFSIARGKFVVRVDAVTRYAL